MELLDTLRTIAALGGAITFIWGVFKFISKLSVLQDIPDKVDNLVEKVEQVDRKVENLTGQFEIFKTFGGRK